MIVSFGALIVHNCLYSEIINVSPRYFYYQSYSGPSCHGTFSSSYGYAINQCFTNYDVEGNPVGSIIFQCSGSAASYRRYNSLHCTHGTEFIFTNVSLKSCENWAHDGSQSHQALCSTGLDLPIFVNSVMFRFDKIVGILRPQLLFCLFILSQRVRDIRPVSRSPILFRGLCIEFLFLELR